MTTRNTSRVKVLVAAKGIDALAVRHTPQSFQAELIAARDKFGNALCGCTKPPLPLVIREKNGSLFLAAWPAQASLHALDCPFFSEQKTTNAAVENGAIVRDVERNKIKLHHPVRKPNRRLEFSASPGDRATAKTPAAEATVGARFTKLHLWGLLHYLWEEAGLNRWHPGWHRDWGFVRHALRRVAIETEVDGAPLIHSLYIPPVWVPERSQEIKADWEQFVKPLVQAHRRSPVVACGFVLGAVREMQPSQYGYVLRLHHHAQRYFMDERVAAALAQYSRRGWSAIKRLDVPVDGEERPHVVAALRVEASPNANLVIVEAVLMRVSPRYIPVNSSFEDRVARLLVKDDRQFIKPLTYDNHVQELPDFVLRDAAPRPGAVSMYVYGPAMTPVKQIQKERMDRASAEAAGNGFWQWNAAAQAQPPPLPKPFSADTPTPVSFTEIPK